MVSAEDYYRRNLAVLSDEKASLENGITVSRVQRLCRIGYNQACYTLEWAVSQGYLEQFKNEHGAVLHRFPPSPE